MAAGHTAQQQRQQHINDNDANGKVPVIPGLSDDIAQLCLIRIPRLWHWSCRQVSRAWRAEVGSTSFWKERGKLVSGEDCPFMILSGSPQWHMFNVISGKWISVPDTPADATYFNLDKECFGAGNILMVVGKHLSMTTQMIGPIIWCFNILGNTWTVAPKMITDRCLFASATMGVYGYVAGGSEHSARPALSTAERFDSINLRWEGLPDMHVARKECSGFIMDRCFWVIGGIDAHREALTSGERYDPDTESWTLIENLWPGFASRPQFSHAPPLVAVVYDQLYALDAYHNQLKAYDKLTNEWSTLDVVPHRAEDSTGWGLGFKAVGGELWVIGGKNPVTSGPLARIDACIMDPVTRVFKWRRVASTWGSGFCFNCAVMKMPCHLLAEGLDIVDMEQQ